MADRTEERPVVSPKDEKGSDVDGRTQDLPATDNGAGGNGSNPGDGIYGDAEKAPSSAPTSSQGGSEGGNNANGLAPQQDTSPQQQPEQKKPSMFKQLWEKSGLDV